MKATLLTYLSVATIAGVGVIGSPSNAFSTQAAGTVVVAQKDTKAADQTQPKCSAETCPERPKPPTSNSVNPAAIENLLATYFGQCG